MKTCVDLIVGLLAVVETREQAPLAVRTKSIAVLPALDQLMIKSV